MFHNGIIMEYLVEYTSDPSLPVGKWTMVRSTDTMEALTDLVCFSEYNISVSARTIVPEFGLRAFTADLVRTLNYSKCHVQEVYESPYSLYMPIHLSRINVNHHPPDTYLTSFL